MISDRELLKDALAAFDEIRLIEVIDYQDLIEEIRTRLSEPEDEPRPFTHFVNHEGRIPLYRHPPRQPEWLTEDEVKSVIKQTIPDVTVSESVTFRAIARAIKEAVLEKNK